MVEIHKVVDGDREEICREEEVEVDDMIPILPNQRESSRRTCKIINTTLDLLNKLLIMKQLHLI